MKRLDVWTLIILIILTGLVLFVAVKVQNQENNHTALMQKLQELYPMEVE